MRFDKARSQRRESWMVPGQTRLGKMVPVGIAAFLPGESGVLRQAVDVELEPIAGRLITDISAKVTTVAVPIPAIYWHQHQQDEHADNVEMLRKRMIAGEDIFPLEEESDISKLLRIPPRSVGGQPRVSMVARAAYNAAAEFLRKEKYRDAEPVEPVNGGILPALVSWSVMERMNGVLDPEDNLNGNVSLTGSAPVVGFGVRVSTMPDTETNVSVRESDGTQRSMTSWKVTDPADTDGGAGAQFFVEQQMDGVDRYPNVRAVLNGSTSLSVKQFYQAQRLDELTRFLNAVVYNNPQHGADLVARIVHGVNIENGRMPFKVFEREVALNRGMKSAMDGASLDMEQTNTYGRIDYTTIIPRHDLGMVVITLLEVKPQEAIESQPHPVLTKPWTLHNHAMDTMAVDPVPVYGADLAAHGTPGLAGNEGNVAFYVGNNHILRDYMNAGWNYTIDPSTVDAKSAMCQYALPTSVNPQSILYPVDDTGFHYPFADNGPSAKPANYACRTQVNIATPYQWGPTPLEELSELEGGIIDPPPVLTE